MKQIKYTKNLNLERFELGITVRRSNRSGENAKKMSEVTLGWPNDQYAFEDMNIKFP